MTAAYDGPQIVGMDLHRRRSVLVRMTADSRKLETARITNSPAELRRVIARARKRPKVVLEATYGWYGAADAPAPATDHRQVGCAFGRRHPEYLCGVVPGGNVHNCRCLRVPVLERGQRERLILAECWT